MYANAILITKKIIFIYLENYPVTDGETIIGAIGGRVQNSQFLQNVWSTK